MASILLANAPYFLEERYGKLSSVESTLPHLGLLMLGAVLRDNGHRVRIIDASAQCLSYDQTLEEIKKFKPDIVNLTAVTPKWLSSMVSTAETNSAIAAVASIVIDGNRPKVLDSCGVGLGLDGMSRQAMRGMPAPKLTEPKEVLLFSGCACLLRKDVLKEVGLFDEDFFAYCEDTDLGLRLRRAGWEIVVAPSAYVKHFYSVTGGKYSLQKVYWVERNHFWVALKNFPWFLLAATPFITMLRYLTQGYSILETFAKRPLLPPATAGCQTQILIFKILNVWMLVPM